MIKIMHYVSVMNRGGQETYLMNLLRNNDRKKISFEFLCLNKVHGDYDDEIISLNGKISYLGAATGKFKVLKNRNKLTKYLKKRNDVDIFEIHTQHAMDAYLSATAAIKAGIPVVIIHSHNSSTSYHPKLHYIFRPLLRTLHIKRVACSKSAGIWMYGTNQKFTIFHNSIDVKEYAFNQVVRDKIRNENNLNDKFVVGNVGRFNVQKNHLFLLDIFKAIKEKKENAVLLLVGDGELKQEIEDKVDELNLSDSVKFLGVRTDVNKLYQCMDILVMPSLYEGLPVTLVEAQASGLPCFISDTITDEIKLTNNIYSISINDCADEWAEKILKIMKDKQDRFNNSKVIEQSSYNIINESKRIFEYYEGSVENHE